MDISDDGDEDTAIKAKPLPPSISHVGSLHVSGQRGVACVNSYSHSGDVGKVWLLYVVRSMIV